MPSIHRVATSAAGAAVAALLLGPGPARAQYVDGLYFGGAMGLNIMQDLDITFNRAAGGGSGQATLDNGFAGLGAIGWGFGNGIRAEIEANYRDNDVSRFGGFGSVVNNQPASGNVVQYGVMANVWWDYDFGLPVIPTIGAGVGYAWAEMRSVRANPLPTINGTEGNFAYQFMAGLSMPIDSQGHLLASLEYRFFGILDNDFAVTGASGGRADIDSLANHSIMLGLRYAVNPTLAPPPPAPVAAAPAPARTYLVFFDFAQAALTDRARGVVAEAAAAVQQTGSARIEVSGHTDTVGSAQYNQALSMRRAEAVAGELERRGIPRSEVVLQAFGFTRPLVPTGPNVREPQNRRVEIVLR
ncbi:MAG: OmpA family protein [Acetobacteraceae bacterium]|nr:OmpA family protein [Acetobacteraceae bacterium]